MRIFNTTQDSLSRDIEACYDTADDLEFEEYEISKELGSDRIVTSGPAFRLVDLGLIILEGTYYQYDDRTGTLEPDWSLTLIYEDIPDESFDPEEYLYYEQDCPEVSLANFLNIIKRVD